MANLPTYLGNGGNLCTDRKLDDSPHSQDLLIEPVEPASKVIQVDTSWNNSIACNGQPRRKSTDRKLVDAPRTQDLITEFVESASKVIQVGAAWNNSIPCSDQPRVRINLKR